MKYLSDEDVNNFGEGLVGYKIYSNKSLIGTVSAVDDTTANILFSIITESGDEILIPATDDFVESIDENKREIIMSLPEGLLEI